MYIRFVSPYWCGECRAHLGFFHAINDAFDATAEDDWRFTELDRVRDWFGEHLNAPDVLERRFGRQGRRQGLCWFRDTATDHIAQARYATWLIEDLGFPTREIRTRRPGSEIWGDQYQIVAIPTHALA